MKNNKKMSEGITLIALVVTIIVLLVLAGISIQMLTGNNGVLQRAGEAKEKTEEANLREEAQVVLTSRIAEKALSGANVNSLKAD